MRSDGTDTGTSVAAVDASVAATAQGGRAEPSGSAGRLGADTRISVRNVTRDFTRNGHTVNAMGPIDLDLREGEFVSIVGPSGCGKSTLLRVVAGLIAPTSGEVLVGHNDPERPLMAMVPQDNSVFPWKTVERNVRIGLDVRHRMPRRERNQVVAHWLGRLGLSPFAKAYPRTLSGGMKQRVAIARALAIEPEVILMDEPFAALDAQMRTLLQEELLALWQQDRRTVLFITHSIEEAILLSDRVLVCSARPGRLTKEFVIPFERPRSATIRAEAEFAALHEDIWEVLRTEVETQMAAANSGAVERSRNTRWRKR